MRMLSSLLVIACLPHNTAVKHSNDTSVNLRIVEGKMKVYLADQSVEITSASLVINNIGDWMKLNDNSTPERQLLIADQPLTLDANLTFKDHHQIHTCAGKGLPFVSLISGQHSSLTHNDCQHSSESPALIYATFDYLGTNLAKYNLLRQIKTISCTISYDGNGESHTLQFYTLNRLSRRITSHYLFTKEGDNETFELSCSLTSDLWPELTKTKKINKLSSADNICVKFGKGKIATAFGDHFNIKVSKLCQRNKFDLIVSFSDEMPDSPQFATMSYPPVTPDDKLKDTKMLVQCPDGCLPLATSEVICKIEAGNKPDKCLSFHLKRESAFYGEFSLCSGKKVNDPKLKAYLRCKRTGENKGDSWNELKLKPEVLMNGKICLKVTTELDLMHVADGNCSSNAEIFFFK